MADVAVKVRAEPQGFGGWLWVVAIAIVVSAIGGFVSGIQILGHLESFAVALPEIYRAAVAAAVAGFTTAVAWVFAGFLMIRRSRLFPKVFIAILIAMLLYTLVDLGIVVGSGGPIVLSDFRPFAITIAKIAVGIPYMLKSRRVRNTFVK